MKKKYLFISLSVTAAISLSFQDFNSPQIEQVKVYNAHKLNSSGASPGYAGAPGESNCTDCHSGSAQDGTGVNSLIVSDADGPVSDYSPGQTYTVTVTFAGAGNKNGFQTIPLSASSNAMAGTVASGTGNKVVNGNAGKKYVTHNSAGNTQTSWQFNWTAPSTNVGAVRFYLATNQSNNNGTSSGDIIRLSQHDFGSFASVGELSKNHFEAGFSAETGILHIDMSANTAGAGYLNLVDLAGNSVFSEKIGDVSSGDSELSVRLPESLKSGIYVIHISVDNNFASKKVAIFK